MCGVVSATCVRCEACYMCEVWGLLHVCGVVSATCVRYGVCYMCEV